LPTGRINKRTSPFDDLQELDSSGKRAHCASNKIQFMITAKGLKEIDEIFELLSSQTRSKVKNPLVLFSGFERWLISITTVSFALGVVLAFFGRSTKHSGALLEGARRSLLLAIIGAWILQAWSVGKRSLRAPTNGWSYPAVLR
jgi:hypothetical protein